MDAGHERPSPLCVRRAPGRARPSRARFGGTTAGCPPMRVVRRFGYPEKARFVLLSPCGRPWPGIAASDCGRSRRPRAVCAPRAASGGRKPWAVRPRSHIVRSARPLVDHYPRTKSEDDAVGAPRLVFRRWGQDLMRPFRHPTAPKRQAPMGRGCRPAVNFYIEVLVRVPGDESVRQ